MMVKYKFAEKPIIPEVSKSDAEIFDVGVLIDECGTYEGEELVTPHVLSDYLIDVDYKTDFRITEWESNIVHPNKNLHQLFK